MQEVGFTPCTSSSQQPAANSDVECQISEAVLNYLVPFSCYCYHHFFFPVVYDFAPESSSFSLSHDAFIF